MKYKSQKEVLGFDPIYILKGDTYPVKESLKLRGARYSRCFGWYFGTFSGLPEDLPAGIEIIPLHWEEVGNPNGKLKDDADVIRVVESKTNDPDNSKHIGIVGDKVDLMVTCAAKVTYENTYGTGICYTFRDSEDNCFVWFTSTTTKTSFEENESAHIKGTIKDHTVRKNILQNVLTRVRKVN